MRALKELAAVPRRALASVEEWFLGPADPRAYGVLRIGYAVSALCVLVDVFPSRHLLFADTGLFGGAEPGGPLFPLNVFRFVHGESAVTFTLLFFGAAIACLALGIVPRLAAAFTYLWTLSYYATAPASQSGFDTILRVVGFVMVIVPSHGSFRAFGAPSAEAAPPAYGLRFVQWQLMLVYLATVWLKAPDPFWRNGDAVTYFLMSMFARFPTAAAAHLGPLAGLFDYGTLFIEASVPFLLWMRRTRFLGVFLGVLLHVGIAATSRIALFSLTILSLYPAYLEAGDFDDLKRWFSREAPGKSA
ncbi:MAG TPA: HTTM domain-containing protein [Polyangiaceae bacterium]|nr:HTTM domain-containing protein [Polyangiaceae bacterium]